jgi:hypothetical protein
VRESYRKSLQLVVASSVLQAYLQWETHRSQYPDDPILDSSVWFFQLILASCLSLVAFGLGVFGTLILLLKFQRNTAASNADPNLPTHVYLAVLLPTVCQVVTILVQIWENTATVRLLGSLLTLCYQWMAIAVVVASCWRTTNNNNNDSWIRSLLPVTVGLFVRAITGLVWTIIWPATTPLPCVGWERPLPWTSASVCIP